MKDLWYSDNRDLVKWAILDKLSEMFKIKVILQIAYLGKSNFGGIKINGKDYKVSERVLTYFREIRNICKMRLNSDINVFDLPFENREFYLKSVVNYVKSFVKDRCIVFLDPDTGLESKSPNMSHVLGTEARTIWGTMKSGDLFVFYQHQTNRGGLPWIDEKRWQLERSIGVAKNQILIAEGMQIAHDVVLFYKQK